MSESQTLVQRLTDAIMDIRAIDVHSHVPHQAPCAETLRDLLGYHYYTELAHSSGMSKNVLDGPDAEMIPALLRAMENIENTVQYSWMIELAQTLFDFPHARLTPNNWEPLAEAVAARAKDESRARAILEASNLQCTFLTNEFDEDLSGVDLDLFVPSLRADTLVFKLAEPGVAARVAEASGLDIDGGAAMKDAVLALVKKFKGSGARSAAISTPPHFVAAAVDDSKYDTAVGKAVAGKELSRDEQKVLSAGTIFAVAEGCRQCNVPFQLMYGAVRGGYEHGVFQGQDLPQSGDTLAGLLPLLNAYPDVTFCLSVLSDSQIHELNSYGWILQNVVLSGHWWYSTIPAYIRRDLAARLQSVPRNKLIGYYSDMYKLEFGLAKFNMYRRTLALTLARDFIEPGYGTEDQALEIAAQMLHGNAARIFGL